jgi:hypothetical protein
MTAVGTASEGTEWRREGSAVVAVLTDGPALLEWRETGSWQEEHERPTSYRNRLRWTWDVALGTLQIHHLRRGADRPVHLADLRPDGTDRFVSAAPHLCDPDRYLAELVLSAEGLELRWEVSGPAKRYSLSTRYLP